MTYAETVPIEFKSGPSYVKHTVLAGESATDDSCNILQVIIWGFILG